MTTEMQSKTRFDDWQDINQCEQCEHWWNNTCDGSKSSCNAFKPTRRAEIPQEIESLKSTVEWLVLWSVVLTMMLITLGKMVLS